MKTTIITLFIGYCSISYSQYNLVPNFSFEQCLNCNCGYVICDEPYCSQVIDWYNPNTCSPDYMKDCYLPPQNWNYLIADGDGFVGIGTYNSNYLNFHEYIACQLLDTMQEEQFYQVSFYARVMAGKSLYASNNLGIHLSDTALHANDPYPFNMNTPSMLEAQVKYFNNEIISDSAHWTLVSGLYQAHGGETWLTIGNFNKDEETAQGMEYTDGEAPGTYFAIDMVSVIPLDSLPGGIPAHAGADTTIFINDTAFIGQKISNMPSNWHLLDGTLIATNTAGLYVSPQETTTYVVSHTLNGIFSADTVTVTVIDNLGMENIENKRVELYPVPNDGNFKLQGDLQEGDRINIVGTDGKRLLEQTIQQHVLEIDIKTELTPGVYVFVLQDNQGRVKSRNRLFIQE